MRDFALLNLFECGCKSRTQLLCKIQWVGYFQKQGIGEGYLKVSFCPAPARAAKPWGQGHLDADTMLQRDSDNI